jgi:nicotinate-nucleotide adenylyltransferase
MSQSEKRQRLGIFGGTFDPIHIGHLLLAEHAREALQLDRIRFIPAAISPLKLDQAPTANDKQRLEMIRLAISGNPFFEVDDRELRRGGTSYTVDTLSEISRETPELELVFLMGGDSLADFHAWREPQRICQLAFVVVLARGGAATPDMNLLRPYLDNQHAGEANDRKLLQHVVSMPQVEISSSDIRQRIAGGRSTRYQLHPAVEAYIDSERLYADEQ